VFVTDVRVPVGRRDRRREHGTRYCSTCCRASRYDDHLAARFFVLFLFGYLCHQPQNRRNPSEGIFDRFRSLRSRDPPAYKGDLVILRDLVRYALYRWAWPTGYGVPPRFRFQPTRSRAAAYALIAGLRARLLMGWGPDRCFVKSPQSLQGGLHRMFRHLRQQHLSPARPAARLGMQAWVKVNRSPRCTDAARGDAARHGSVAKPAGSAPTPQVWAMGIMSSVRAASRSPVSPDDLTRRGSRYRRAHAHLLSRASLSPCGTHQGAESGTRDRC